MQKTTIDELSLLLRNANKPSLYPHDISSEISSSEKILLCLCRQNQMGVTPIDFFVLTEFKLIFEVGGQGRFQLKGAWLPLDTITLVKVETLFIFGTEIKLITNRNGRVISIPCKKDKALAEYIANNIKKAVADAKFRIKMGRVIQNTSDNIADQLTKLSDLHKNGIISEDEYIAAKNKLLK